MKRSLRILLFCLLALSEASCGSSYKMPKHKKNRRCDCPRFSEVQHEENTYAVGGSQSPV